MKESGIRGKFKTCAILPSPTTGVADSPMSWREVGRMGLGRFSNGEKASALTL
jgi:hypothetical protein